MSRVLAGLLALASVLPATVHAAECLTTLPATPPTPDTPPTQAEVIAADDKVAKLTAQATSLRKAAEDSKIAAEAAGSNDRDRLLLAQTKAVQLANDTDDYLRCAQRDLAAKSSGKVLGELWKYAIAGRGFASAGVNGSIRTGASVAFVGQPMASFRYSFGIQVGFLGTEKKRGYRDGFLDFTPRVDVELGQPSISLLLGVGIGVGARLTSGEVQRLEDRAVGPTMTAARDARNQSPSALLSVMPRVGVSFRLAPTSRRARPFTDLRLYVEPWLPLGTYAPSVLFGVEVGGGGAWGTFDKFTRWSMQ